MPFVGVRSDHLLTKSEELVADHVERLIEPTIFERCVMARFDKLASDGALYGLCSARPNELAEGRGVERPLVVAEVSRANDLALVHRDSTDELGAIFCEQQLREQCLGPAEFPVGFKVGDPSCNLPHQLGIGGVPAETVNDVLLLIGAIAVRLAVWTCDQSFDRWPGGQDECLRGIGRA